MVFLTHIHNKTPPHIHLCPTKISATRGTYPLPTPPVIKPLNHIKVYVTQKVKYRMVLLFLVLCCYLSGLWRHRDQMTFMSLTCRLTRNFAVPWLFLEHTFCIYFFVLFQSHKYLFDAKRHFTKTITSEVIFT